MLNVLFINVSLRPHSDIFVPPIGLGYVITSAKKTKHNIQLLDLDLQRPSYEQLASWLRSHDFDVACLGTIVTGYSGVKEICSALRKRNSGCKIIVGNTVASTISDILLTKTDADIAVLCEGDELISDILDCIDDCGNLSDIRGICYKNFDGKIIKTDDRPLISDLDSLDFVNWDLFDIGQYLDHSWLNINEPYPIEPEKIRSLNVNSARGCPHKCGFCRNFFTGKKYRTRSFESIFDEIEVLIRKYGVNYVGFFDDLTFYSKSRCTEFINEYAKRNLKFYWVACCRADLFKNSGDETLAKSMKETGCVGFMYSLESANKNILAAMNKNLDVEDFVNQSSILKKIGIPTLTSIVIGYPEETEETIRETFRCCEQAEIYPSAGYLLPQPGTSMYDYARNNGIITDEEKYLLNMGDRQDFYVNMTKMSDNDLKRITTECLRDLSKKLGIDISNDEFMKTRVYKFKGEAK